ncbi:hypothetical protein GETHLI_19040 [Geothrix limicola]|uniref:DUF948 domain-containing protein n=1 Tax=Geothrix limicola TaxID=2927978 RepID=A0ABQ5QEX9_9BACT|nr:hypothetical protein [Geothrix limicola]GLH73402.1 hypothetical protein GETHLI_19040 [Geothrix limicola]
MSIALEITLIVVLIALAAGVVPLLVQLRTTARGLDRFLLSAKSDLSQIAEDVHASRLRMDQLAGTLQITLGDLSTFTHSIREVGSAVKDWHARFRSAMDSTTRNLGGLIGGVSSVLAFFKSKQAHHETEKEHAHERT